LGEEPTGAARVYFCRRCGSERFGLEPCGRVRCARCGAVIDNLRVREIVRGTGSS